MPSNTLDFLILARDRASGTFRAVGKASQDAGNRLDGFRKAAKLSGLAMGAAAGAAAAFVVKTGVAYEDSMLAFQAASRSSAAQMKVVGARAKELGADLTLPATSAGNAAAAMTELVKGGLSVADSMAAAKGALQLAAAAGVDEATAATIAARALNAFSLKGKEADRVADILAASANASTGEITDMAAALQMAAAVFGTAGLKVEDLATAISQMANAGIVGSDAGTSLKVALMKLQAPAGESAAMIKKLGINIYDSTGTIKPFRDIIEEVTGAVEGMTQKQRDMALAVIFGTDGIRAANIVLAEGTEKFDTMKAAVTRQGVAAEVSGAKTKGLSGAVEGLKSQLETLAISIYEDVAPSLTSFVRFLSEKAIPAFANLAQAVKAQWGDISMTISENLLSLVNAFDSTIGALDRLLPGGDKKISKAFESARESLEAWNESARNAQTAKLEADKTDLDAKLAEANRQLRDPKLTATKRARLEAEIVSLLVNKKKAQDSINSLKGKSVDLTAVNKTGAAVSAAQRMLNSLPRSVTVRINAITGGNIATLPDLPLRAHGGPVSAGRPYIVGEEGPEILVPKQSGTVISNKDATGKGSAMGMGGMDPNAFAEALVRKLRASGLTLVAVDSGKRADLLRRAG